MAHFQVVKTVSALPGALEANALYLVRAGDGFDLYATTSDGATAHKINDEAGGMAASATPPAAPAEGDKWFDLERAQEFVFLQGFWVQSRAYGAPGENGLNGADGANGADGPENVPPSGAKSAGYALQKADVGQFVEIIAGGSITIPSGVFAPGDVVSLLNNTGAEAAVTCSALTAYLSGQDGAKASVALLPRGLATVLFVTASTCVIAGAAK